MEQPSMAPEERYETLVQAILKHTDATFGSAGTRGFGSTALHIGGKIFAMLSHGKLVVKLPRQRVDALVATGAGERFDPRRNGTHMKEWFVVDPASREEWLPLAHEALRFVATR